MAASEQAFNLIKWLRVAYLVYVGVSMLRSNASSFEVPSDGATSASRWSLYVKGLLAGASNPKALLFFTAFFP